MLINAVRCVCAAALVLFSATSLAAPASPGEEALANLRGKTILLAGATGRNGSHVLRQLHDLGLDVRAMTRNVERAIENHGSRYNWIKADVTQPETLTAAVEGVDIVINAVASATPIGSNRPELADYEGTKNLSRAAKDAGATRFVIITSSNSGVKDHFLNTVGGNVLIWKGKAEEVLVESGLEYVVVGPAGIDDSPGGEKAISLIPRSEYQPGMVIGRDDLATVTVAAAGHPDAAKGETPLEQVPIDPDPLGADPAWIDDIGALRTLPCYWPERGGLDGFFVALLKKT